MVKCEPPSSGKPEGYEDHEYAVKGELPTGKALPARLVLVEIHDSKKYSSKYFRHYFLVENSEGVERIVTHVTGTRISENAKKHPSLLDMFGACGIEPEMDGSDDTDDIIGVDLGVIIKERGDNIDIIDVVSGEDVDKPKRKKAKPKITSKGQATLAPTGKTREKSSFLCPECGEECDDLDALRDHMEGHKPKAKAKGGKKKGKGKK